MLETIDEASIGRDAMLMNRVLLSTASGEYENALRLLLQGGEGVDDAAACAKKIYARVTRSQSATENRAERHVGCVGESPVALFIDEK